MGNSADASKRTSFLSIIRISYLVAFVVWTGVIASLYLWDAHKSRDFAIKEAHVNALASYNKDVAFREWATMHGGVYVPATEKTPPNPYLTNVKERDVVTPSGRHLTLMNPAYMARQMNEYFATKGTIFGHITSLNLKNPNNKADKWEEEALRSLAKGEKERMEITEIGGKPFLRLIRPIITKEGCLKCHADQGYRVGDVRGGVSVSVGLEPYYAEVRALNREHAAVHGLIWLVGVLGLLAGHGYARRQGRTRDEAEDRFRQLSEAAFDGVAIHAEGVILDCNAAYSAMMGYGQAEIIGLPVVKTVAPEFHDEVRRRIKESYAEPFEAMAVKKDGSRFPVEAFGKNIVYRGKPARISVIRDLTRRKKAEEALRKNEAILNQTQRISHVGGWEYDVPSGKMRFTEETYRIHEVGPEFDPSNIDANIAFYSPDEQAVIERAFKRAVESGEPYDLELRFTGAKGTPKWVRTAGQAERIDGKVVRVFGTIIDVTAKKRAEMELLAAKDAAEEANRLKSEFISNMTHELNTPLTSVLGYSRLAGDRNREMAAQLARILGLLERPGISAMGGCDEIKSLAEEAIDGMRETEKYDATITEQGQRLFSLLNDLMDLSMIESGNIKLAEHAVSTFMLLTTIARYYTDSAKAKGLSLSVNAGAFRPVDLLFTGDGKWLEKILGNLVQNAIKFSDAGVISVTAEREGERILFRVRDQGIGMGEVERKRIFDDFRQLDGSTRRSQGGVGLGLTLAKKLVREMGGDIEAISEPGKGSEFVVTIPARPARQ